MTPFSANPFVFIFSVVVIVGVIAYFGWGALDRLGLAEEQATAVVTDKHFLPPGVSYRTNIVAGRAWTQSDSTAEIYSIAMKVGEEPTVAIVSQELHTSLKPGDTVHVRVRRTRLSRRLEVVEVLR